MTIVIGITKQVIGKSKMKFEEWLEQNREELLKLLRNDTEQALYLAWIAGMEYGLDEMADFTKKYWQ